MKTLEKLGFTFIMVLINTMIGARITKGRTYWIEKSFADKILAKGMGEQVEVHTLKVQGEVFEVVGEPKIIADNKPAIYEDLDKAVEYLTKEAELKLEAEKAQAEALQALEDKKAAKLAKLGITPDLPQLEDEGEEEEEEEEETEEEAKANAKIVVDANAANEAPKEEEFDFEIGDTPKEEAKEEAPAEEAPANEAPAEEEATADEAPAEEAPANEAPANEAPAEEEFNFDVNVPEKEVEAPKVESKAKTTKGK